ncbi:MAG: diacylglycerol kinase family protein [bacterium]|nr:diacylglycerol kinase family protein [bacterium]
MHKRLKNHSLSVRNALNGIFWVLYTQPNFQLHVLAGFCIMIAAYLLSLSYVECAVLALTVVFVLVCELINTAIEAFVDLLSSEWQGQSKVIKDVSAGMVLVSAIGSVFIGAFIFIPHLLPLLLLI